MGEQPSSQKEEKCGWGPNCPFCKAQKKDLDPPHLQDQIEGQQQKPLPKLQAKKARDTKHIQGKTAMGGGDGKVECEIQP